MTTQYLVQWTIYAQRVVEAKDETQAISKAVELGPDWEISETSPLELPEARRIEGG
ncbi:MAG: hypothetical protein ACOC58_00245 [Chloroflexota bacterium]